MKTMPRLGILVAAVLMIIAAAGTASWVAASDSPAAPTSTEAGALSLEDGGSVAGFPVFIGDVNCDGFVNSIDALFILFFDAALISTLPCLESADVNGDGVIDAVDAALILQFDAGLIDSLPADAVLPLAPEPTGTPAKKPTIRISSLSMDVGGQGEVQLEALDIQNPGLGAWTIDISYDPDVVTVKDCAPQQGGVCNPEFGDGVVRVTGANAGGLEGDTILAFIAFTCDVESSSELFLSISVLADATIGDPQDITANIVDGEITCDIVTPVPPTGTPTALPVTSKGRMTGGGSVFTYEGLRVTHGFELHCNANVDPNNLEINWEGNSFHLESLDFAFCSDDPAIEPNPPAVDFDKHVGRGRGRYNGVSGATAEWFFMDAGEPGDQDWARIVVVDAGGNTVLSVSGNLNPGNHQAHRGGPQKPTPTPPITPTDTPTETPTPTRPSKPTVNIGSLSMMVGEEDAVDLEALSIPAPGLGAWTIDVVYDEDVVSVLDCASHPNGVCNPAFNSITIRSTGASATGLDGDTTLATITFLCDAEGASPLTLSLEVFADATLGAPQDIRGSTNVLNGSIECVGPGLPLADTDGDGCADEQERGPNPHAGGRRDPTNPWDFYDTNGDGIVDLSNDILGVLLRHTGGGGSYDARFDRGPSAGPNPWNMTAPDGTIDLPNDILGVILQYGHDCR